MGEVWLATASGYGGFSKTVVLKTLLPELASDPLFVDLLAREAKTCSKLSHPNLIEVFDFTEHDGVYLLAMEHVLGQPLSAIMKAAYTRGSSIPPWFALRVAWECCCGLQYAHDQGVIHCDLSPSNVMVTYTGATKVLDFGVAHIVALGPKSDRLKGKSSYMAPERIRTHATDRRTDIYALGVMLYLVFTGQLPFTGESDAELLYKITHEQLVAPSSLVEIELQIEAVILRAMHPDPTQRFQTVAEVREALAPSLDGQLGTYGQQHVAAFVNMLFSPQATISHGPSRMPPIPRIAANPPNVPNVPITQPGTVRPAYDAGAVGDGSALGSDALLAEEIEIDLESALDTGPAIPRPRTNDPATAPVVRPAVRSGDRVALGSTRIPPIIPPIISPVMWMPKPIAAFGQASTPHEPKTSVQALFGDRRTTTSTITDLFARGTRDDLANAAVPSDPAPRSDERNERDERDEVVGDVVLVGADLSPALPAPRGVFDGYSGRRASPEVAWPWPVSRSKSP
jgi:serine/threonine-protein kinase